MSPININDMEYDNQESQVKFSSSGRRIRKPTHYGDSRPRDTTAIEISDGDSDLQRAISLSLQKTQQFAGLINHGATCYLNSLLQCLFVLISPSSSILLSVRFMTPEFRMLVLSFSTRVTDFEDKNNSIFSKGSSSTESKSM